jgi:hypothetical protein
MLSVLGVQTALNLLTVLVDDLDNSLLPADLSQICTWA